MRLSSPMKTAIAISALVVGYFIVSAIFRRDGSPDAVEAATPTFTVIAKTVSPESWSDRISIRGRTEAANKITVRAEWPGQVTATPVAQGAAVKKGAVLCRIKDDARNAALAQARASLRKAQIDYNAASKLAEEGFRSESAVASMKAALDVARANAEQASVNVGKAEIKAPFDGVFDQRFAEVGDFLGNGDPCGVVIQRSPFLVVGSVSERSVARIRAGDRGTATLATGETVDGAIRFVSAASDPATRTFRVELEVPNTEGKLRDGVTASFIVFAEGRSAHRVPRSALTLNDEGELGVRLVSADDTVSFATVALIGEDEGGVWVSGLDGEVRLITRGQDFVNDGQKVAVAAAPEGGRP